MHKSIWRFTKNRNSRRREVIQTLNPINCFCLIIFYTLKLLLNTKYFFLHLLINGNRESTPGYHITLRKISWPRDIQVRKCKFFVIQGQVTPKWVVWSDKKQPRKGGDIIFPIISQWGFSVAMETRVLIQSAPKPYAAFLYPSDARQTV